MATDNEIRDPNNLVLEAELLASSAALYGAGAVEIALTKLAGATLTN